jgi:glycerol-1-phosphate dehydrogenase [NAD(P)+]
MQGAIMISQIPIYIGDDASERLIGFCRTRQIQKVLLIADRNTSRVLASRVEAELAAGGFDIQLVLFDSREVVADARHVMDVLAGFDGSRRTFIAIGAGTITDITRFVSHRTGNAFISMPTAPSVDGYASIGAPLIVRGVKNTYITQPPAAIFADLATLAAAPAEMIAAGFADMLGKYTSIADWRLGHLLWNEPYNEGIAGRTLAAVQRCVAQVEAIRAAGAEAIRGLMEALIESGLCMRECGNSRPASGTEHHYSHFWEMQLLHQGRPAILHGAKVGVATVQVARLYALIRQIPKRSVADLLAKAALPRREAAVEQIRSAYGADLAEEIIAGHGRFLDLNSREYGTIKSRIRDRWDQVQEIAHLVPEAEQIADLLRKAGGPATIQELGLASTDADQAARHSHFLRDRFTVRKLLYFMGLDPQSATI